MSIHSDSFEASTRIPNVFDIAPETEPMKGMTFEERQSLVKVFTLYSLPAVTCFVVSVILC